MNAKIVAGVLVRLFVFGLIWIGVFHLYTTILDTNWHVITDIIASFMAATIPIYNNGFRMWFFMENN